MLPYVSFKILYIELNSYIPASVPIFKNEHFLVV